MTADLGPAWCGPTLTATGHTTNPMEGPIMQATHHTTARPTRRITTGAGKQVTIRVVGAGNRGEAARAAIRESVGSRR